MVYRGALCDIAKNIRCLGVGWVVVTVRAKIVVLLRVMGVATRKNVR